MQTVTSETESKSLDLSICVHHYTLRAPCPKDQVNKKAHLRPVVTSGRGEERSTLFTPHEVNLVNSLRASASTIMYYTSLDEQPCSGEALIFDDAVEASWTLSSRRGAVARADELHATPRSANLVRCRFCAGRMVEHASPTVTYDARAPVKLVHVVVAGSGIARWSLSSSPSSSSNPPPSRPETWCSRRRATLSRRTSHPRAHIRARNCMTVATNSSRDAVSICASAAVSDSVAASPGAVAFTAASRCDTTGVTDVGRPSRACSAAPASSVSLPKERAPLWSSMTTTRRAQQSRASTQSYRGTTEGCQTG